MSRDRPWTRLRVWIRAAMLSLAAGSLVVSPIASASVGSEMQDFFSDVGVAGNVTGPAAFEGQSAGYYTGGSIYTRVPQKSVNPVNLQLPSARAGCGGIDLFAGSFSFINTDEFVAMLKATASNALGFAFQLAISSISPVIATKIAEMSQAVQQMNQWQMNSCQMAQQMVGGLWPKSDATASFICRTIGNAQGKFADMARSKQECDNGGKRNQTLAGNSDDKVKEASPNNYTWTLLKQSYPSMDVEMREFLMTLVGTVIYNPATSGDAGPQYTFKGIADEGVFSAMLDGTAARPAKMLKCSGDTDKCLNVTEASLSISTAQALKPQVETMILSMMDKVRTNTALSNNEIGLLGATSLPIYKMVTVSAASQFGGLSPGEVSDLSEYVAVDMLQVMLAKFHSEILQGGASFQGPDVESMKSWREQIEFASTMVERHRLRVSDRVKTNQAILEKTIFLEKTLRNSLSPQMTGALNFSRATSAHGLR
ncbi:conjugative transfer pilus assembly protein TraH [Novosphingobium chloroacetimidivorans]|uniref:Conjugative transfer pilus assembly protein TraH n=1 Tax=Novosphingobium chloroacetimidivorans TaxID=1428314 RepID=A0A7W7NXD1_9SPHN|nr:conjugal transfer protein TraH [Novosphingobium chloroacetimidivorans]MBB4860543.1 conjugative transfer pilus assembly protein TraH [Novosphingobium chloroacetimidivorans]